ncbi:MAG: hypothetical protein COS37_00710 [Anaerolineae bacterium CG03_land_8_20_14_0_80_58_20]|nr:MAG: hypothetical protein COS37_00710 [Anaerolineae bacterium CG03_land_8_20_14_0_80_58_20]
MATLSTDVLQDDIAVSLARVMTTANKRARELGVDILQSLITITQHFENGLLWRINYGPKDYIGKRGGDLTIEVGGEDMKIKQVLRGQ